MPSFKIYKLNTNTISRLKNFPLFNSNQAQNVFINKDLINQTGNGKVLTYNGKTNMLELQNISQSLENQTGQTGPTGPIGPIGPIGPTGPIGSSESKVIDVTYAEDNSVTINNTNKSIIKVTINLNPSSETNYLIQWFCEAGISDGEGSNKDVYVSVDIDSNFMSEIILETFGNTETLPICGLKYVNLQPGSYIVNLSFSVSSTAVGKLTAFCKNARLVALEF